MSNLSCFLAQNACKTESIKYAASKRFVDADKKPVLWEIQSITSKEDEELRKMCTKRVQVPGKRGIYSPETDHNAYIGKLAAKCTVFPNLNDAELQSSYNVMGADALLKTMLSPGEYAEYINKIQEINGFDISFEDSVEEAKNS
jgi:hypothetical protein